MKKTTLFVIILLLTTLVLVGAECFDKPKPETEDEPEIEVEPEQTAEGSSFETAIVIEADNTNEGIAKEYEWLAVNACLDKGGVREREMQEFREYKGHKYDLMYMLCNNGEKEVYYFQIDSFFGKW